MLLIFDFFFLDDNNIIQLYLILPYNIFFNINLRVMFLFIKI